MLGNLNIVHQMMKRFFFFYSTKPLSLVKDFLCQNFISGSGGYGKAEFHFLWPRESHQSWRQSNNLPFWVPRGQVWSEFTSPKSLLICNNITLLLLYLWLLNPWMLNVEYSIPTKVFQLSFSEHEGADSKRTRLLF